MDDSNLQIKLYFLIHVQQMSVCVLSPCFLFLQQWHLLRILKILSTKT